MTEGGTPPVLLVDASDTLEGRLRDALRTHDYESIVVESASECLDFIEAHDVAASSQRRTERPGYM